MSLFNRRILLLTLCSGALAACGFTPVYGPGGAGSAIQGRILFKAPATEEGYLLVRNLEERLGRTSAPDYVLEALPILTEEGQGVTEEGDITRFSIVGKVRYTLRQTGNDTVLFEDSVENFTGYSATGTTVETLAAQNDARLRLMLILAEQITTRLLTVADNLDNAA